MPAILMHSGDPDALRLQRFGHEHAMGNLLKPQFAKHANRSGFGFPRLGFHDSDALLHQVSHGLADQKRRDSASAVFLADFKIVHAPSQYPPVVGQRLNIPKRNRTTDILIGFVVDAESISFGHPNSTAFPPGPFQWIGNRVDLILPPKQHLFPVDDGPKTGQLAFHHNDRVGGFKTRPLSCGDGGGVVGEKAGNLAATVESQVKRRMGKIGSTMSDLGTMRFQERQSALQQFIGDLLFSLAGDDFELADDPHATIEVGQIGIGSKSSMDKSDGDRLSILLAKREDQALGIKIRFCEYVVVQHQPGNRRDLSSNRRLVPPDVDQKWWVRVEEAAILNHGWLVYGLWLIRREAGVVCESLPCAPTIYLPVESHAMRGLRQPFGPGSRFVVFVFWFGEPVSLSNVDGPTKTDQGFRKSHRQVDHCTIGSAW